MPKQKVNVIVKVSDNKFLKYRGVTNLNSLVSYLEKHYPSFRWFNYYAGVRPYNQLGSYTKKLGFRSYTSSYTIHQKRHG